MCIKREWTRCVVGVITIGLLFGAVATAQYPMGQYDPDATRQTDRTSQQDREKEGDLQVARTSQLIGQRVNDTQGERLGIIHDLVLTPDHERVSYLVLSSGGFWGIGANLHAIPWSALQKVEGDTYVLNISKQRLDNAEGFDRNRWPSQADARWSVLTQDTIRSAQQQGTTSTRQQDRTDWLQQDQQMVAGDRNVQARRVSRLTGMDVQNYAGEDIGNIEEFVVSLSGTPRQMQGIQQESDRPQQSATRPGTGQTGQQSQQQADRQQQSATRPGTGQAGQQQMTQRDQQDYDRDMAYGRDHMQGGHVVYTVISMGGFLGFGQEYALVPANAVRFQPQRNYARLDTDKETLEAIAFKPREWPDLTSRSYAQEVHNHFDEQPYWAVLGFVDPSGEQQQIASRNAWAPDSEYNQKFDADNIKTIEGTVQSIGSFEPVAGVREGLRLRVQMDDGEMVTVYAGPQWYAQQKNFSIRSGDRIQVTGSEAEIRQRSVIMATKIESADGTLELRSEQGEPKWGDRQMRQQRQRTGSQTENEQQNRSGQMNR